MPSTTRTQPQLGYQPFSRASFHQDFASIRAKISLISVSRSVCESGAPGVVVTPSVRADSEATFCLIRFHIVEHRVAEIVRIDHTDDVGCALLLRLAGTLDRDFVDVKGSHQRSLVNRNVGYAIEGNVGLAAEYDAALRCDPRLGQFERVELPISRGVPGPVDDGDYGHKRYSDYGDGGDPHNCPEQVLVGFRVDLCTECVGCLGHGRLGSSVIGWVGGSNVTGSELGWVGLGRMGGMPHPALPRACPALSLRSCAPLSWSERGCFGSTLHYLRAEGATVQPLC